MFFKYKMLISARWEKAQSFGHGGLCWVYVVLLTSFKARLLGLPRVATRDKDTKEQLGMLSICLTGIVSKHFLTLVEGEHSIFPKSGNRKICSWRAAYIYSTSIFIIKRQLLLFHIIGQ